jgi:hypothetical protein
MLGPRLPGPTFITSWLGWPWPKATARQHAEIAKERAFCDGPPHCYKKALDEAEEMLAKLH